MSRRCIDRPLAAPLQAKSGSWRAAIVRTRPDKKTSIQIRRPIIGPVRNLRQKFTVTDVRTGKDVTMGSDSAAYFGAVTGMQRTAKSADSHAYGDRRRRQRKPSGAPRRSRPTSRGQPDRKPAVGRCYWPLRACLLAHAITQLWPPIRHHALVGKVQYRHVGYAA